MIEPNTYQFRILMAIQRKPIFGGIDLNEKMKRRRIGKLAKKARKNNR